jgi:hypothetical protein
VNEIRHRNTLAAAGNLGVFIFENFAKEEDRAFDRSQTFEQQEKRHGTRFIDMDHIQRIARRIGNDGFR